MTIHTYQTRKRDIRRSRRVARKTVLSVMLPVSSDMSVVSSSFAA